MDLDLDKAQEEWWNDLTDEEREREVAEAIMEARRLEEFEANVKAHDRAEYEREIAELMDAAGQIAEYENAARYENYPMVDGEQHPRVYPDWDEIPF